MTLVVQGMEVAKARAKQMFLLVWSRLSAQRTTNTPTPKLQGWKVGLDAHHRIDIAVKLQEIMLKLGKSNERMTPKDLSHMQ